MIALEWLRGDPRALLMVDRSLAVVWANERAEALLNGYFGLLRRDGIIAFAVPENERRFRQYLARLGSTAKDLVLPQPDHRGWIMFGAYLTMYGTRPVACVRLRVDGASEARRYHDLREIFSLTPAEHRVVLRMLDGHRADAIALESGVSIGTVRSHVRRIYQKLAVSSREQLLSVFRPYVID